MGKIIGQVAFDFLFAIATVIISVAVKLGYGNWIWSTKFVLNSDVLFVMITSLSGTVLARILDNLYSVDRVKKGFQVAIPVFLTALIFIAYFFGFQTIDDNNNYIIPCLAAEILYVVTYIMELGGIIYYCRKYQSNNANGLVPNAVSYENDNLAEDGKDD